MKSKLLILFNALSSDEQKIKLALAVIYAPIVSIQLASVVSKIIWFELKQYVD